MTEVLRFRGEYAFLSNFHPSLIEVQGRMYPTVEHAYQTAKTSDPAWAERIRTAAKADGSPWPGEAKRLGRRAPLRPEWDLIRDDVMLTLVRVKFTTIPELAQALLGTGTRQLVEGNDWGDDYWGMVSIGVGQYGGENRLGHILMRVRSELLWRIEPDLVRRG